MRRFFLVLLSIVAAVIGPIAAQDSSSTLPKNYRTVFENSALAIIHAHYAPHETVPVHDHSKFATVYVYLSDSGPVKFSHVEEHPFTTIRKPLQAGAYRVSPGRIERHSAENQGDIPTDFLRVELKQVPVRHFTQEFRAPAPASLSQNSDTVDFSNPDVATERIICIVGSSCEIKAASSPSVTIAFTPVVLSGNGANSSGERLKGGDVSWMNKGESLTLKSDSSASAHVLRILLPSSQVTTGQK
jgi:predicted metal-dependent enzyme (double-stranded beta helix superfamily)